VKRSEEMNLACLTGPVLKECGKEERRNEGKKKGR
jgi:hypothetical protein